MLFSANKSCITLKDESNALICLLPDDLKKKIFHCMIDNGIGVHTYCDNQNGTKWKFDEKQGCSIFLDDNVKVYKSLSFQNGAIVNLKTKKIFFPNIIHFSLCCKQLYEKFKKNKLHLESAWLLKRCLLPIEAEISFQEVFFDMEIPTLHYLNIEKAIDNKIFIVDGLKGLVNSYYFEFKPQIKYLMYLLSISKVIFNDSMNFQTVYFNTYLTNRSVFCDEYNSPFYQRNYSFFVTTFILSALCNVYVISMKDDYLLSMIKRYYSNFQTLFQENKELQQKIHFIEKICDNSKNMEDAFSCIAHSCELFFHFLKDKKMENDKAKKNDIFNNEKKIIYYYLELLNYLDCGNPVFNIPLSGEPQVIRSGFLEIRKSFMWSCLTSIKFLFIKKYCDTGLPITFFNFIIPYGSNYFFLKVINGLIFDLIHVADLEDFFVFFHYVDLNALDLKLHSLVKILNNEQLAKLIFTLFKEALLNAKTTKEHFFQNVSQEQQNNFKKKITGNVLTSIDLYIKQSSDLLDQIENAKKEYLKITKHRDKKILEARSIFNEKQQLREQEEINNNRKKLQNLKKIIKIFGVALGCLIFGFEFLYRFIFKQRFLF